MNCSGLHHIPHECKNLISPTDPILCDHTMVMSTWRIVAWYETTQQCLYGLLYIGLLPLKFTVNHAYFMTISAGQSLVAWIFSKQPTCLTCTATVLLEVVTVKGSKCVMREKTSHDIVKGILKVEEKKHVCMSKWKYSKKHGGTQREPGSKCRIAGHMDSSLYWIE